MSVNHDQGEGPDRVWAAVDQPPARPLWVKVFLAIAVAFVLLFVIIKLLGVGGEHGPGRHTWGDGGSPASNISEHAPPAGVPDHAD